MRLLGIALLVVVAQACADGDGTAVSSQASGAGANRGGENGICEHGVLESLCPIHTPGVAAVFRAKGDWCDEHELPESICPLCHPERGGRPAVDVSSDEPPPDGVKVTLRDEHTAALAGLVTAPAVRGDERPEAEAFVHVTFDATRVFLVGAPASGVVRTIAADVGTPVKAGQVLATLDSAAVGADRSRLGGAEARLRAAESALAREQHLKTEGIAPQKDVEAAERERDAAAAEVRAAAAALGVVGAGASGAGGYRVVAPAAGVVLERKVAPGSSVAAHEPLFEIVDPSMMWAELDLREDDLGRITTGQRARIILDALPSRTFTGIVDYLAPVIDPRTRTARAHVHLENNDGVLRANMLGRAQVELATATSSVFVPLAALQETRGQAFVFVEIDERHYEGRRVTSGAKDEELVEIERGVAAGELVVTTGSFFLLTETLRGEIGAGCCE